jgi:phage anti-repressor protein
MNEHEALKLLSTPSLKALENSNIDNNSLLQIINSSQTQTGLIGDLLEPVETEKKDFDKSVDLYNELDFYKTKYQALFKECQTKEKFIQSNDLNYIKSQVIMEVLANPEKLDVYLEKIKKEYSDLEQTNKLRRKDYLTNQITQMKIMCNLYIKDSKMKSSTEAYISWLVLQLNEVSDA